jgi:hypothetical protein
MDSDVASWRDGGGTGRHRGQYSSSTRMLLLENEIAIGIFNGGDIILLLSSNAEFIHIRDRDVAVAAATVDHASSSYTYRPRLADEVAAYQRPGGGIQGRTMSTIRPLPTTTDKTVLTRFISTKYFHMAKQLVRFRNR